MEEDSVAAAGVVFVGSIALALGYLWVSARRLRDALDGKDGHRLMRVVTRVFAGVAIAAMLATVRLANLWLMPDEVGYRVVLTMASWAVLLTVHVWAVIEVRAIINLGDKA